jgi:hypothetical protein
MIKIEPMEESINLNSQIQTVPTKATFHIMFDGNDPKASGYHVLINPDNIDMSVGSLMIKEDRVNANRMPLPSKTTTHS